jgi:DNA primase small subunit
MPHSISPNSGDAATTVKDEPMDGEAGIPSNSVPAGTAVTAADDDVDMNDEAQTEAEAPSAGQAEEAKKEVKLDELFADVDSDDEFPSSAPVKREGASSPARAASPSYVICLHTQFLQRKRKKRG